MRIPLIQRLHLLRLIIHNHTRNSPQLPRPAESIRRAARLIAEPHVVCVLIVKRNPLRFSRARNVVERNLAVIPTNPRRNNLLRSEIRFLVVRRARHSRITRIISRSIYGRDLACLDVQIVHVVPDCLDGFGVFVHDEGKPDVARLPEGDGIPLVAEVEVGRFLGAVDAQGEAGLGVVGAGVEGGDYGGLGPGATEIVGAEGYDVCEKLAVGFDCGWLAGCTIWAVAGLVAHEGEVAPVGLDDGRGFEIVFVEAVDDFVESGDVVVE